MTLDDESRNRRYNVQIIISWALFTLIFWLLSLSLGLFLRKSILLPAVSFHISCHTPSVVSTAVYEAFVTSVEISNGRCAEEAMDSSLLIVGSGRCKSDLFINGRNIELWSALTRLDIHETHLSSRISSFVQVALLTVGLVTLLPLSGLAAHVARPESLPGVNERTLSANNVCSIL